MARLHPAAPTSAARHAERLGVPWWWWLAAVAVTAGLAAELWLGAIGARSWLPFAVLLPPVVGGMWWLGRIRVEVRDAELRVDDARLPTRFIADAVPLDAGGRRELLGPAAHPLAFVIQRPWIPGAVQVLLDDPADPTPYWVISSRRPAALAAAILAARAHP
ncbi:MAG TPA: DUF3093 domain-containing protein [Pilimelia sp.]|nr:DUF3093 domain-containing protein [Pilimelia sp.]